LENAFLGELSGESFLIQLVVSSFFGGSTYFVVGAVVFATGANVAGLLSELTRGLGLKTLLSCLFTFCSNIDFRLATEFALASSAIIFNFIQ
jgi:hypothetical protein